MVIVESTHYSNYIGWYNIAPAEVEGLDTLLARSSQSPNPQASIQGKSYKYIWLYYVIHHSRLCMC